MLPFGGVTDGEVTDSAVELITFTAVKGCVAPITNTKHYKTTTNFMYQYVYLSSDLEIHACKNIKS